MKLRTNEKISGTHSQHKKQAVCSIRIQTGVKAGEGPDLRISTNHNQTLLPRLKVKSGVKVGEGSDWRIATNHNQTLSRSLKIKSDCSFCG